MTPRARLLALAIAALHLAVALAPCPGNPVAPATSAELQARTDGDTPGPWMKRACPCGCKRGPASLVVAGIHAAPPPAAFALSLPRLRHAPAPDAQAPPSPPLRAPEPVPIPA